MSTLTRPHHFHLLLLLFISDPTWSDLRGHVLYDAVEKVETLVVVGLGGDELLENSEQTRLRQRDELDINI